MSSIKFKKFNGSYYNCIVMFSHLIKIAHELGSHQRQVHILVLDDKLDCFGYRRKKFAWTRTV